MNRLPLLLLHGALGSKAQFDALLPELTDHFIVHPFDFEGHGDAPQSAERPFYIERFAENVLNYLDSHHIPQGHFFGYSMGGYVALYLALIQPARVGKVFTLATKFDWTPEAAAKEVDLLDADKILAKIPKYAAQLEQQHRAIGWKAVLEKTKGLLMGLGERNLLQPAALAQIQAPVRIGLGDRDTMVSLEESVNAYRILPNGEFQVFPRTPHPFDRVSPEMLANAIVQFNQS